jgi:hypothetical protein
MSPRPASSVTSRPARPRIRSAASPGERDDFRSDDCGGSRLEAGAMLMPLGNGDQGHAAGFVPCCGDTISVAWRVGGERRRQQPETQSAYAQCRPRGLGKKRGWQDRCRAKGADDFECS